MKLKRHIPDLFTLANLSCGFLVILLGDLFWGPILILLGGLFDVFDGMIARKLGVSGDFGKELDSLADVVTFGAAPAYLFFLTASTPSISVYIGTTLIVLGGAYRLATFNTLPPSKFFKGMPIPASGLFFAGLIFGYSQMYPMITSLLSYPWVHLILGALFAYFMNSGITMFSLKSIDRNSFSKNIPQIIMALIIVIVLIISPYLALPVGILSYFVLSLVFSFDRTKP